MIDHQLIDIPEEFESARLFIRAPQTGYAREMQAAIAESYAALHPWMVWAKEIPTIEQEQVFLKDAGERFQKREDFPLHLFFKENGALVGASGLHNPDWSVPKFEIGYWIRSSFSGQGFVTEAVEAISEFAFRVFKARRVEIRTSTKNVKSWQVAERAGFTLEGILRNHQRHVDGTLRDTKVYAKVV